MESLIHATMFGAIICFVTALVLFFKKQSLWKNFLIGGLACLVGFFASLYLAPIYEKLKEDAQAPVELAPLIDYQIQSLDAPSKREVEAWRKGLLCALTYNILVEKDNPTQAEFQTIIHELVQKDAQQRSNWNVIYFQLRTPESLKDGVAYMTATYALNGHLEQANKVKPGQAGSNYKAVIRKLN